MAQKLVKVVNVLLSNRGFVVFLKNEEDEDERTLPIFIGVPEAQAIAVQFNKLKTPRPLTHDLIKNVLTLLDCKLTKVVVNALIDNTYFAKVYLETKDKKFMVDSRPSDAIALALRFEIPIYVEEDVIEAGAMHVVAEEGDDEITLKDPMEDSASPKDKPNNPKTKLEVLEEMLQQAVSEERYEDAANIRDEIKKYLDQN